MVTILGESKKEGLIKCLILSNLQGLFVPRAGTKPGKTREIKE